MIDINGKPFIYHQLKLLKQNGIESVIICVGYLSQQIMDYVDNGKKFGLEISYSIENSANLLGTGGAVKKAIGNFSQENFFVMYGDSYLDVDLAAIWQYYQESQKAGLMTVIKNNNQWDKSNVLFENGEIINYSKDNFSQDMEYIDYGISIFNKKKFFTLSQNDIKFDLAKIHIQLIEKKQLAGYEVFKRFYEIGSSSGIKELQQLLNQKQ